MEALEEKARAYAKEVFASLVGFPTLVSIVEDSFRQGFLQGMKQGAQEKEREMVRRHLTKETKPI